MGMAIVTLKADWPDNLKFETRLVAPCCPKKLGKWRNASFLTRHLPQNWRARYSGQRFNAASYPRSTGTLNLGSLLLALSSVHALQATTLSILGRFEIMLSRI